MSKKMNFKGFIEKFGIEGIISVTSAYAYGSYTVTIKGISDEFNATESAVKSCIKYAIIHCIVSYQTALVIKQKAHCKQASHIKTNSNQTPSDKYYDRILEQRLKFVNSIRDDEILEIITYYLASVNTLSINEITENIGYSEKELKVLLKNAVNYKLIDAEIATKIECTPFMQVA